MGDTYLSCDWVEVLKAEEAGSARSRSGSAMTAVVVVVLIVYSLTRYYRIWR